MTLLLRCVLLGALAIMTAGRAHATTYATWIMVWYGHDQAWWKAGNADASLNLVNGEWKTLDWSDEKQYGPYLDGIKRAGVTVVIADLTNGWGWLDARCKVIQKLCAERGMKFCVAENSGGNIIQFENHARDIYNNFVGPNAPNHDAYFRYRGKPLIVCYAVRDWYRAYLRCDSEYRSRFSLVWASGEDSCVNKWGWQLEPWVGSIPSTDSMYVTSAVRWDPSKGDMWRKSIAWMDYNFALARKINPAFVIVGSYDDPTERNNWLVSDTAHCELGRQIRDRTGTLNPSALYDRVREWITGKPSVVPGGLLRDGAYRILTRDGKPLGIEKGREGFHGAALAESVAQKDPVGLFWLYHLGGNHYRVIHLAAGLALESSDGRVIQSWDTADSRQRWTISRAKDGCYRLKNDATGLAREWRLKPVITLQGVLR